MRETSPTRDLVTPWEDLDAAADHAPTAPAVTVDDARFTYQQLRQEAQDVARGLTALGVGEGDRVTLHMTNSRELLASYYGCFRLGAIACPLNVRLTLAELRPMLDTIGPVAHLSQPALDTVTAEALTGVNRIVTGDLEPGKGASSWDSLLEIGRALDLPEVPQGTQPAVLFPTSGTTGTPKFVAHSATTLAATAGTLTYEIVPGGRASLVMPPWAHAFGFYMWLSHVRRGTHVIAVPDADADGALDCVEKYACDWVAALPHSYLAMLAAQHRRPRQINSLRHLRTSGDVCPHGLQQACEDVFGTPLRQFWASTEIAGALTYGTRPGPVSRITPGTEVKIVDDYGAEVPAGESGELWVRGPSACLGYWRRPGTIVVETADGWIATGDVFKTDAGDLWFLGRKKDLIVRGGSNVAPAEIEQVLEQDPIVVSAAVVGQPDEVLGEKIVAFVELAGASTPADVAAIAATASSALADYKVPEKVEVVEKLPRTAAGKIDRAALRGWARSADHTAEPSDPAQPH
jgi:long-chain acyl-CoA synthetase